MVNRVGTTHAASGHEREMRTSHRDRGSARINDARPGYSGAGAGIGSAREGATGLVDSSSLPQLLRLIASGPLDPSSFATQHSALGHAPAAYDTFAAAATRAR